MLSHSTLIYGNVTLEVWIKIVTQIICGLDKKEESLKSNTVNRVFALHVDDYLLHYICYSKVGITPEHLWYVIPKQK